MKLKEKDEALGPEETNKTKEGEESKSNDFSNPIVILKRRLSKITEINKEKRRLMD